MMGRLASLRPAIGHLPPRLGFAPGDEKARDRERQSFAWRRWYKTARWRRLRMACFERDGFVCRCGCGTLGSERQLVADHVVPHRGDERLFFDLANLQTLTKRCHDRWKQAEEQASLHQRGIWY